MAVRERHEQFPLNKGGKGRRPWGLSWQVETVLPMPERLDSGFRRNDNSRILNRHSGRSTARIPALAERAPHRLVVLVLDFVRGRARLRVRGSACFGLPCQCLPLLVPTPARFWGNQSDAAQPEFLRLHLPQVMFSFQNRAAGFRQREGKLAQVWIVLREAKAFAAIEPQYRLLALDQADQNIPELSIAQPIPRLSSAPLPEQLRKAADASRDEFQRHLLHVPKAVSD